MNISNIDNNNQANHFKSISKSDFENERPLEERKDYTGIDLN